jgi:predicted anti-sigma-YlaC factor YlaD
MTCDQFDQLVDDYLEQRLDAPTAREAEAHLSTCAACRTLADELRALHVAATALPREIQPARNLWPGIAARLEAPPRRATAWKRWAPLAIAASVLVAVTALLTERLTNPDTPTTTGATQAAVRTATFDADREYAMATDDLERLLAERRAQMAPATVAVLERNLALIDAAIAESRAALAADPANADLRALLWGAHRQKLELLERATRLTRS